MRRWVLVAAAVAVAACGGRSTPTTPDPGIVVPLHLSPGLYTLTLDLTDGASSGAIVCPGPATATFPVVLERENMDLTVEPQMTGASLRLRLLVSGDDRLISGTMIGSAVSEEGTSIEVYGATTREPALISGRADPTSIQGMIMGQLS